MENTLNNLTIRGFKSIKELDNFELKNLNVFVGANGAGKSNLLSFFKMLNMMMDDNLDSYIYKNGGISDILYNTRKTTEKMSFSVGLDKQNSYEFVIEPTAGIGAVLARESHMDHRLGVSFALRPLGNNLSGLVKVAKKKELESDFDVWCKVVYDTITSWKTYHFHDTSPEAPMRHERIIQDHKTLHSDASNIAPFLLDLRENHSAEYQDILNTCQIVMPFLKDFLLDKASYRDGVETKIRLSWQTKTSNMPMQPYHLSDGSIRFICLAAALLQPELPSMLIIDEPELGLHPEAIHILGEMINSASKRTQVIIATQSPLLLDQFDIEDIVVVNRKNDQSVFERLNRNDFNVWLEDYSVGELWEKNVIQGGIRYE